VFVIDLGGRFLGVKQSGNGEGEVEMMLVFWKELRGAFSCCCYAIFFYEVGLSSA
jgi:hypothetical protein